MIYGFGLPDDDEAFARLEAVSARWLRAKRKRERYDSG